MWLKDVLRAKCNIETLYLGEGVGSQNQGRDGNPFYTKAPLCQRDERACDTAGSHSSRKVWIASRLLNAVVYVAELNPQALRYESTALASKSLAGRSRLCVNTCCPQIVAGAVALTCTLRIYTHTQHTQERERVLKFTEWTICP